MKTPIVLFAAAACLVSSWSSVFAAEAVKTKINLLDVIKNGEVEYHVNPKADIKDDPKNIWKLQPDGTLYISGNGYGYVATKQDYRDYHLVVEFKWGEKTWGKRESSARDNGILLHAYGPHGAVGGSWMASIEAQIIEGGTGDILILSPKLPDGTVLTTSLTCEFTLDRDKEKIWKKGAPRQTLTSGRVNWEKRDVDWADKKGFRGANDVEAPVGEWNRLEVIAKGDTLQYFLNGVLVNEGFEAKPSEGKILLQTEAAEMIVRRYELHPLGAFKEKWQPAPSLTSTASAAAPAAAPATFEWVAGGGGAKNDKTRGVTFDRQGNLFLVGETSDDGTFGGVKRQGLGGTDFFLAKVAPQGSFQWVRSLGGSLVDRGYGVATDKTGNVYVTGHYQSTDVQANGQTLPNAGDYDVFVAKYDSEGALQWVRTAGGKGYDYGHGIAVDSKGDIVVTGAVSGEAQFGDVAVNAGNTTRPIFCAKYDAQGQLLWVKTTTGKFSGSGHGVGVDAKDAIYIGGSGSGVGSIGKLPLESSKGQAAVAMKLTADGDAVWAKLIPGKPSAGFHEITVDAEGRVWCAGMFKGEVTAGEQTAKTTGPKDSDGIFAHFSPTGKLEWSHVIQGPRTDYALGVTTDGTGRAFVTGEFSATATFAKKTLTAQGGTDIYTAAFDSKGALEWIIPNGGAKGDNAYTMAWHPTGRIAIAGACVAPATFGTHTMSAPGAAEAYAAVLRVR